MDIVTICNSGLALAGARSIIATLAETNPEGQQCTIWYDQDRKWLLRSFNWGFAREQGQLSLLATAPGVDSQPATLLPWPFMPWAYSYSMPEDSLRFRHIIPTYNAQPVMTIPLAIPQPPVPFIVSSMADPNGNAIECVFTNQVQATGVWTRDLTDPNVFDAMFVEALEHLLASHLAVGLSGDKTLAKQLFEMATTKALEATSINGNEGLTIQDMLPDWIRVRGFASDYCTPYYPWDTGWGSGGWGAI